MIATVRDRSVILWTILGVLSGPIAVGLLLCIPSRKAVLPPISIRSLASEIRELEELRERGLLSDDEFAQGKARVLASPLKSEIPPALPPNRALSDSGWTWASYQPATRAAFIDLAQRHRLNLQWRDDVPFEVVCTFPVQPRLSFSITLALEKGSIHCWGDGWAFDGTAPGNPEIGLPADLAEGLEALLGGSGRFGGANCLPRQVPVLDIVAGAGEWALADGSLSGGNSHSTGVATYRYQERCRLTDNANEFLPRLRLRNELLGRETGRMK